MLGATRDRLFEMRLCFGRERLLARADIDDGRAILDGEGDGAGQVELRGVAHGFVRASAEKDRQNETGAGGRDATHLLILSEDQAANPGPMLIGPCGIRRDHRLQDVDGSCAQ